jgi:hypothetical protein
MPRSQGNPNSDAIFWDAIAALKKDFDRLQLQVLDDASSPTTPNMAVAITSPGYSEAFTIVAGSAATCSVMFDANGDAGTTTGLVRAVDLATGTEVHAATPVTLGTGRLTWDMDLPITDDEWRLVQIQALLTSGTGTLTFRPYGSQGG